MLEVVIMEVCGLDSTLFLEMGLRKCKRNQFYLSKYRKVASTNASRFVTRLVYMHTQNDNFIIRSPS